MVGSELGIGGEREGWLMAGGREGGRMKGGVCPPSPTPLPPTHGRRASGGGAAR